MGFSRKKIKASIFGTFSGSFKRSKSRTSGMEGSSDTSPSSSFFVKRSTHNMPDTSNTDEIDGVIPVRASVDGWELSLVEEGSSSCLQDSPSLQQNNNIHETLPSTSDSSFPPGSSRCPGSFAAPSQQEARDAKALREQLVAQAAGAHLVVCFLTRDDKSHNKHDLSAKADLIEACKKKVAAFGVPIHHYYVSNQDNRAKKNPRSSRLRQQFQKRLSKNCDDTSSSRAQISPVEHVQPKSLTRTSGGRPVLAEQESLGVYSTATLEDLVPKSGERVTTLFETSKEIELDFAQRSYQRTTKVIRQLQLENEVRIRKQ